MNVGDDGRRHLTFSLSLVTSSLTGLGKNFF